MGRPGIISGVVLLGDFALAVVFAFACIGSRDLATDTKKPIR
jgi:hypothetical protein